MKSYDSLVKTFANVMHSFSHEIVESADHDSVSQYHNGHHKTKTRNLIISSPGYVNTISHIYTREKNN